MKKLFIAISILFLSLSVQAGPNQKFVQFLDQQIRNYESAAGTSRVDIPESLQPSKPIQYSLDQVWLQVIARFSVSIGLFKVSFVPEVELEFK
ncbi:MAG: hypothetical protein AB7O96_11015 [Pseudobdellovibrionaceae bacterium]